MVFQRNDRVESTLSTGCENGKTEFQILKEVGGHRYTSRSEETPRRVAPLQRVGNRHVYHASPPLRRFPPSHRPSCKSQSLSHASRPSSGRPPSVVGIPKPRPRPLPASHRRCASPQPGCGTVVPASRRALCESAPTPYRPRPALYRITALLPALWTVEERAPQRCPLKSVFSIARPLEKASPRLACRILLQFKHERVKACRWRGSLSIVAGTALGVGPKENGRLLEDKTMTGVNMTRSSAFFWPS